MILFYIILVISGILVLSASASINFWTIGPDLAKPNKDKVSYESGASLGKIKLFYNDSTKDYAISLTLFYYS